MAFAALRHAGRDERLAALRSAAGHLLTSPEERGGHQALGPLASAVLGELDRSVRLQDVVKADVVKKRLLTDEMVKQVVRQEDIKFIRDRLGKKGLLSPSEYHTVIDDQFVDMSCTLGVTKTMGLAVVGNPGHVSHLLPERSGLNDVAPVSLFIGPSGFGRSFLLVLARRDGAKLALNAGWHLFPEDVAVDAHTEPLDALRAFTDVYGIDTHVGGVTKKLFINERIRATGGDVRFAVATDPAFPAVEMINVLSMRGHDVLVALVFTIDTTRYIRDLRARGIKVTRRLT